jgi:hypothetical protein
VRIYKIDFGKEDPNAPVQLDIHAMQDFMPLPFRSDDRLTGFIRRFFMRITASTSKN